mgnify:CR=1 FL=1
MPSLFLFFLFEHPTDRFDLPRFAINDAAVDWSAAESQVSKLAKGGKGTSSVVSLKTTSSSKEDAAGAGQKRKAGGAETPSGGGEGKKNRRSKKVKR